MKTVKQWLKDRLSKEDYKKAKKYEHEGWKYESSSFKDALNYAFHWRQTREGAGYWNNIHNNGGSIKNDSSSEK